MSRNSIGFLRLGEVAGHGVLSTAALPAIAGSASATAATTTASARPPETIRRLMFLLFRFLLGRTRTSCAGAPSYLADRVRVLNVLSLDANESVASQTTERPAVLDMPLDA